MFVNAFPETVLTTGFLGFISLSVFLSILHCVFLYK